MTVKLALAQLSSSEDRQHNLERVLQAVDEAAAQGAEMIVYPEVVLDRFFPQHRASVPLGGSRGVDCVPLGSRGVDCCQAASALAESVPGPTTEKLAAKAREHGIVVVFNLYEVDGDRYFDSSPVIDADGELLGVTRMIHITDYEGFHEQDYYHPGDTGAPVYDSAVGKIGVAICYDRHYPEYMRALAVQGAELVVIPQAGCLGEWPDGLFEAEIRTAAFQNGYFAALCNRVGAEEKLVFAGESFAVDPDGRLLAQGRKMEDDLVVVDLDLKRCAESGARRLFLRDRRPELYAGWISVQGRHS